jgi:hypothetical protein
MFQNPYIFPIKRRVSQSVRGRAFFVPQLHAPKLTARPGDVPNESVSKQLSSRRYLWSRRFSSQRSLFALGNGVRRMGTYLVMDGCVTGDERMYDSQRMDARVAIDGCAITDACLDARVVLDGCAITDASMDN